jgi:hypothetical protein
MAEYAGYVAPTPIDYGSISSGLLSNRLAVEKLKKAEKSEALKLLQKQQAADEKARMQERKEETEDEKLLRADIEGIKAADYIPQKSFTIFANEGLNNIKSKVFELNKLKKEGKITNQDYLINYNNLKDQWNQFTAGVKSFKDNMQAGTKAIQEGKASKIGAGMFGMFLDTAQLSNKVLGVKDENGVSRLQQYTIDKDGKQIEDQTITNIGTLADLSLYFDNAVDYNKRFEEANKAVGQVKIETGSITVESQQQNEKYKIVLDQQINGILSNDMDKARMLTENMGYSFYFTAEQKKALLDKGIKEENMVEFKLNEKGAYSPIITKAQNEAAVKYTTDAIVGRMNYSKTLDEPKPMKVTVNVPKPTESTKQDDATLDTAIKDWDSIVTKGSASPAIRRIIKYYNNIYRDYGVNVKYVTKSGKITGIKVYPYKSDKTLEDNPTAEITGYEDMFGIYTPKNKAGGEYTGFDEAMKRRSGRYGNQ